MATEEPAAGRDAGDSPSPGSDGPEERVSVSLLILQRVDHLEQRLERLEDKMETRFAAMEDKMDTRFATLDAKIDGQSARMLWLFGLILVAVVAKVFIPHL